MIDGLSLSCGDIPIRTEYLEILSQAEQILFLCIISSTHPCFPEKTLLLQQENGKLPRCVDI